VNRDY